MFVDRVTLDLVSGKGGNGIVAWRREKYIPKGGPAGGNGGQGGSIILQADTQIFCLEWYRHKKKIKAENGRQGGPNQRRGRNGKSLIIKVPLGTLVKDSETGEVLHDFTEDEEKWEICLGGRGGRGNCSFKSPTNRAPNTCTQGKHGEEKAVELELKLIADIGLVGFPNAGKSTLINALAYVRVKIAPYPFTTLRPNIGFIKKHDYSRTFIADIPGIIENAHQDRGLGLEFLRHIERTKLLFFVLDTSGIDGRTPTNDYRVLRNEIKAYNPDLLELPHYVILNKIDTEESAGHLSEFYNTYHLDPNTVFELSALNGEGVSELLEKLQFTVDKEGYLSSPHLENNLYLYYYYLAKGQRFEVERYRKRCLQLGNDAINNRELFEEISLLSLKLCEKLHRHRGSRFSLFSRFDLLKIIKRNRSDVIQAEYKKRFNSLLKIHHRQKVALTNTGF